MTHTPHPPHRSRAPARPRQATQGFTLVEMIVTLVLFGLMAATLVLTCSPASAGMATPSTVHMPVRL